MPVVGLHDVVRFVRDLRHSIGDAAALDGKSDAVAHIATRIGEHFTMERRGCEPDGGLLRTGRPLTEHEQSGAVLADETAPVTIEQWAYLSSRSVSLEGEVLPGSALDRYCTQQARDLLLGMGIAADEPYVRRLVTVFHQLALSRRARGEDQQRLFHLDGEVSRVTAALEQATARLTAVTAERELMSDALGLDSRSALLPAIRRLRADRKALTDALGLDADTAVTPCVHRLQRLQGDCNTARAERDRAVSELADVTAERGAALNALHLATVAESRRRGGDLAAIATLMAEVRSLQAAATDREARTLRRVADELENGVRAGAVPLHELVQNEVNWCRAQANNIDPLSDEVTSVGGARAGKQERLRPLCCPTCASQVPEVVKRVPVGDAGFLTCTDVWHGASNAAERAVLGLPRAAVTDHRSLADRNPDRRYDGCPVCQAWADGQSVAEMLRERGASDVQAEQAVASKEPHMAACDLLGVRHDHEDIR